MIELLNMYTLLELIILLISFFVLLVVLIAFAIGLYRQKKGFKWLVLDEKGKFSLSRVWTNVAFFFTTLVFLKINFMPDPHFLVEIWVIYLSALTGNGMFTKWIEAKKDSNSDNHKHQESDQSK